MNICHDPTDVRGRFFYNLQGNVRLKNELFLQCEVLLFNYASQNE